MEEIKKRRTSLSFDAILYCYVEKACKEHVKTYGKQLFGSESAYVNTLICKDMGRRAKLGAWQARGEAKKKRAKKKMERVKERARKRKAYLEKIAKARARAGL